jgi:CubicO group peptidase (beta-lactamase class C family)
LKTVIKWSALALLVAAILVIAHEPLAWIGYLSDLVHGHGGSQADAYGPYEIVPGGNQPPAPRESPVSESLDPSALEAAAAYAAPRGSKALIVSRHGYLVFEKYWQGTSFDTVIDSRELARVLVALATGVSISERKIGWPDEPIGFLLPELSADPRGRITVRNLLQLSSGLGPATVSNTMPWNAWIREKYGTDLIRHDLRLPLAAPPGSRWVDQSVDPELLAHVLGRTEKMSYGSYLSRSIWQPLGAADAKLLLNSPGGDAHVDRGFMARQGDWIRVGQLLIQNGRYQGSEVLVPRWLPQLLQPAKSNSNYGSYVRLGDHPAPGMTPYATNDVFTVEGGGNRLWFIPSLQMVILRTGERGKDWDDGSIPNLIIRGTRDFVPPVARPGADLRQLVPNH